MLIAGSCQPAEDRPPHTADVDKKEPNFEFRVAWISLGNVFVGKKSWRQILFSHASHVRLSVSFFQLSFLISNLFETFQAGLSLRSLKRRGKTKTFSTFFFQMFLEMCLENNF